jgi:short-subunit dehydrogenase
MSNTSKIVLITGATAGIGRFTALHLAKRGHHVIASGRKVAELTKLREEAAALVLPNGDKAKLDTVILDVTSQTSIEAAKLEVEQLTNGHGLDVLVNNAGFGILGPTSEIDDSEMRRQYETNVFGLMNVTRAFLPKMRERRSGRIVNISSLGGRMTLPYFGVYNSTKYAIESLSDALRFELRAFNIDVTLVEPGVIRTSFEATAVDGLDRFSKTPYAPAIAKYEKMSKQADKFASEPIVVAKAIARAVEARRPAARYMAPFFSNQMVMFMKAILPQRVWDWALRTVANLDAKTLGTHKPAIEVADSPTTVTPSTRKAQPEARAN